MGKMLSLGPTPGPPRDIVLPRLVLGVLKGARSHGHSSQRGYAPILQVCTLSQMCRIHVWAPCPGSLSTPLPSLEGLGVGCRPWGVHLAQVPF